MATDHAVLRSTFGPELADCGKCELRGSCKIKPVYGERPATWTPGGLMILGEGPGTLETSQGRPFVGAAGKLLDALLEAAGVKRQDCWVTNATLGQPPRELAGKATGKKQKTGLHDRFPLALYSCLPRLEAEIQFAQPRVIVTLGHAAFLALAGHETHTTRLAANTCDRVDCVAETRKLDRPCIVCANGACGWFAKLEGDADAAAVLVKAQHHGACPSCGQSIMKLRPRLMKCPSCGGKKRRVEQVVTFDGRFSLVGREGVAGAVFPAEELPSRLDAFGVRFVIPTYHPSFCLRSAKLDKSGRIAGQFAARACVDHLRKARELLTREPRFAATARVAQTAEEVRAWFEKHRGKPKAVDIESNAMGGPWSVTKITVIGFAVADDPEALVVDTRGIVGFDAHGHPVPDPLLDELDRVLSDADEPKVWHNGNYDRLVILRVWGIDVQGTVGDTMFEHSALYPDEEQGLGFVAHELLDAPHWKGDSHKIPKGETDELSGYASFDELATYNAKDVRATILADEIMRGPVGGKGRIHTERVDRAFEIDMAMQTVTLRMESVGLPIDTARFAEIEASCLAVMDRELSEMRSLLGLPEFTPTGPQLVSVLYDPAGPLRLPVTATTEQGAPSTAKEVLAKFSDHPFVQRLLRWRKYQYALSHYIRGAGLTPDPRDRRIHPQWKVTGTVTGRWSSSPNFQNWPKGDGVDPATNLRSAIVAPPGRVLVGADYDQLELRVMANLSGDAALIARCMHADETDKLNPDKDPHAYVARLTFGEAYVHADKAQRKMLRDVAKRVVYGLNYGAGAETILAAIYDGGYDGPPLTKRIVQSVIEAFFRGFPGVPRWRNEQVRLVGQTNEVRSPVLGRRREFPLGEVDVTIAYNFPIQSGASDVVNLRLLELLRALPSVDPTAELIAQVHDAVYFEADEDRAELVAKCLNEHLPARMTFVPGAPDMAYTAAAAIAKTWDKAA